MLKLIYSEKTTNFCEIDLSYVVTVKSTLEISQNFVAFSEYLNFTNCMKTYRKKKKTQKQKPKRLFDIFSRGFVTNTMRTNLLNWCNLVSISKTVVFYAFGVVRIY